MTQCEMVLDHIKRHGSISSYEAFSQLGITRLPSRIFDLRKHGYDITHDTVRKKNRYGKKVKFYKYKLAS